jgi:hypothetical protein
MASTYVDVRAAARPMTAAALADQLEVARVAGVVPTSGLLFGQGRADNRFQCNQRG